MSQDEFSDQTADETASAEDPSADPRLETQRRILAAAMPSVPFDGWSEATLEQAIEDAGVDSFAAKLAFPRGAVDLALFFHREGDRQMLERLAAADLSSMRIREKVAFAVRTRLEIIAPHREAVRKGAALYALPIYAADGAQAVWETADHIWTALGDPSDDLNWYTKRAILSGVYGSTVLYWLGDESLGSENTWAFLDRRIEGVMRFESLKRAVNDNPLGRLLMTGPNWLASRVRKPGAPVDTGTPVDLPG
ncbi:MAG: COQ9 family protein [Pseudomonadota bacterium]